MKIYLFLLMMCSSLLAENGLSEKQAGKFVELALAGLNREFPNKPGNVMKTAEDVISPREMSPVFFGHFDWHSSVHGHWTLVRLVRLFPKAEWNARVGAALDDKFTAGGLKKEADRLAKDKSFERMYGWAWALRLGMELRALDDEQGRKWSAAYLPLEQVIVSHANAYLPKLDWPVRCGFHPESAFPLSQMLDWARATGDVDFEKLLVSKAKQFYGKDTAYAVRYEPSGNDFFSPGLNEADLMRRVLPADAFRKWLGAFFPNFDLGNLSQPVSVSDLEDGHLVHLVGLNLSRAWTMRGIASVLDGEEKETLLKAAKKHEEAGLKDTFSGSYEGEHWLGSFAVYLMTGVGR
ncbi:hypothetical protein NT6N_25770 [Oceaniferula spumae]|uniref:DUF2891 domain-containing protein n=1 Tax=Oceaniferula spumae TaxID=2979115 RepID=A0AAT9FN41_9BACT